jgi:hypothetical protein
MFDGKNADFICETHRRRALLRHVLRPGSYETVQGVRKRQGIWYLRNHLRCRYSRRVPLRSVRRPFLRLRDTRRCSGIPKYKDVLSSAAALVEGIRRRRQCGGSGRRLTFADIPDVADLAESPFGSVSCVTAAVAFTSASHGRRHDGTRHCLLHYGPRVRSGTRRGVPQQPGPLCPETHVGTTPPRDDDVYGHPGRCPGQKVPHSVTMR